MNGINSDQEIRRLESIVQSSVQPRIIGLQTKAIEESANGSVIVMRIPKSWNSPHMVTFKNSSRFYARNSAGKYQLDVDELRSVFIASESLAERIRQFRSDRIAKILADETPAPLESEPKIVLHFLPLASFSSNVSIDFNVVGNRPPYLQPIHATGWNHRYNFDGLLTYTTFKEPTSYSYAQIFRNGAIEAVEAFLLSVRSDRLRDLIPSVAYEQELIKALQEYLDFQRKIELNPPILVMLSLLGVKGYRMGVGGLLYDPGHPIDRDLLLVPEIVVEDYGFKASDILRPAFDAVWQACGWDRSRNYDENGDWVGDRR